MYLTTSKSKPQIENYRQVFSSAVPQRNQMVSPDKTYVQQPGRPLTSSVQRIPVNPNPLYGFQTGGVNRILDFKQQTSPPPLFKESLRIATMENREKTRPSIKPVSFTVNRTGDSRMADSSISTNSNANNFSVESICNQLDRRSHKSQVSLSQKENQRNSENVSQKIVVQEQLKDKFQTLLNQLRDIEPLLNNNLRAQNYVSIAIQTASQLGFLHSAVSDQMNLWKNKCMDMEMKNNEKDQNKDQEYNRLKQIMESLQSKLTVLVDENSRLSQHNLQQNIPSNSKNDDHYHSIHSQLVKAEDHILHLKSEKEDIIGRFSYERQMHEREREKIILNTNEKQKLIDQSENKLIKIQLANDQLRKELQHHQLQLQEKQLLLSDKPLIIGSKISISSSDRQIGMRLEQAEMKILTVQMANDDLMKELQHRDLDQKMNENLRSKIGILETKVQELIREKETLVDENETQSEQYSMIFEQLSRCEQQLKHLMNENNELKKQSEFHQNQIKQKINEYVRDKKIWEQESKCLQESLHLEISCKENIEYDRLQLKEQQTQLQQECNRLNVVINQFKEYNQDQLQSIEQYKSIEFNHRQELDYLKKHNQQISQEKCVDEEKHKKEVSQLSLQLSKQISISQSLSLELQQTKQKYASMHQEIVEMKERWNSRLVLAETSGAQHLQSLESQCSNLSQKLQEKSTALIHLENKQHIIEQKYQQIINANTNLNRELQNFDNLKTQYNEIQERFSQTHRTGENIQNERDELRWRVERQSQELELKGKEINEKSEESRIFKLKYNDALQNLDRVERKLLEKMEQEVWPSDVKRDSVQKR